MNMRFLFTVVALLLYAGGVQAQFTCTTNNDTITITGYTGPGGQVTIPSTINTYSVIDIGPGAFSGQTSLTGVTIPNSVTNIGNDAFGNCSNLTSVTIPDSVTNISDYAFSGCSGLTSVTIPDSVTNIGNFAFNFCTNLVTVSVPDSVTTLGQSAFLNCYSMTSASIGNGVREIGNHTFRNCNLDHVTIGTGVTNIGYMAFASGAPDNLQGVYFRGDAPAYYNAAFSGRANIVVFYIPGTAGWGSTYDGYQTVPWDPEILNLAVGANGFGFTIKEYGFSSTLNYISVVEACTNLVDGTWIPLQTNVPVQSLYYYFNDPQWTNHPARFYRLDMP